MDPLADLISNVEETGHRFAVEGGRLAVSNASTLTNDQRAAIHQHRDQIVAILRTRPPGADAEPCPPLSRPVDPSTATWLAALPEHTQRFWWRRTARHFCRFQSWEAAEAFARREVEAELAGRPVALPLKLSAWPMCEALLYAEGIIADHDVPELEAMERAAAKYELAVECFPHCEDNSGTHLSGPNR